MSNLRPQDFDGLYGLRRGNKIAPNVLQTNDFDLMEQRYELLKDRITRFFDDVRSGNSSDTQPFDENER